MNAGRLVILRVSSLLEGRDAQNERDRAGTAQQQQQLRRSSSSDAAAAPSQQHYNLALKWSSSLRPS